jgi:hypothetical protein
MQSDWDGFRVPGTEPESRRAIEEICLEELGNVALCLLSQEGNTSREGLAKAVCRLLGISRTTTEAEDRIYRALVHGPAAKRIKIEGGIASALKQL